MNDGRASQTATGTVSSKEFRVYLDATISMAGFVGAPDATEFDSFIDEMGDMLPGSALFRYGQEEKDAPADPTALFSRFEPRSRIHDTDFYSAFYNPDDRLVEYLAGETPAVNSVIVTDGVYSEPAGNTPPAVVDAYRKCMQRGLALGIVQLHSQFTGKIYSESRRKMLDAASIGSRPFYAFVLSPNSQAIKDLVDKIHKNFPDAQLLLLANAATPTVVNRAAPKEYATSEPGDPFVWRMFTSNAFSETGLITLEYAVELGLEPTNPASEVRIDTAVDYYTWQDGAFVASKSGPPEGYRADSEKSAPSPGISPGPLVRVSIPLDASVDYGFYRLRFTPTLLATRSDLASISTRDDSLVQNGDRTFRFYELVTALAETHFATAFAESNSLTVFITVASH